MLMSNVIIGVGAIAATAVANAVILVPAKTHNANFMLGITEHITAAKKHLTFAVHTKFECWLINLCDAANTFVRSHSFAFVSRFMKFIDITKSCKGVFWIVFKLF